MRPSETAVCPSFITANPFSDGPDIHPNLRPRPSESTHRHIMLTTPPFAPSTLQALHRLGIRSREELRRTGAVKTFLLLKASGRTPTRSVLWQLAAACLGCDVMQLSDTDKTALLAAVKTHPPVALPPPAGEAARFMRLALNQAEAAAAVGEVPVGAVVVRNGEVLSTAHNRCVADCDIGGHAELRALAEAGRKTGSYRLDGCDVYITLEPCAMCTSALIQARVARVVYGAAEPKSGAAGSVVNLFSDGRLNKHTAVFGGILAEDCQAVLQHFFRQRRSSKPEKENP